MFYTLILLRPFGICNLIAYLYSIFFVLIRGNIFTLWVFSELNLIIFLRLMHLALKRTLAQSIKYLVIQRLASGLFLIGAILRATAAPALWKLITLVRAIIKLGLAPFHEWFFSLTRRVNWTAFFFIATLQKIPALIMFKRATLSTLLIFVVSWSLLVSIYLTSFNSSFRLVLAASSLFNTSWFLLLFAKRTIIISAFVIYIDALIVVTWSIVSWRTCYRLIAHKTSQFESLGIIISLINLGGIPPFAAFWTKLIIVCVLQHIYSTLFPLFFISGLWFLSLYLNLSLALLSYQRRGSTMLRRSHKKTSFISIQTANLLIIRAMFICFCSVNNTESFLLSIAPAKNYFPIVLLNIKGQLQLALLCYDFSPWGSDGRFVLQN